VAGGDHHLRQPRTDTAASHDDDERMCLPCVVCLSLVTVLTGRAGLAGCDR
jgi:hypothetical protein